MGMTMSYMNRIERLEAALTAEQPARPIFIWSDEPTEVAVARYRAANNWPDDGRHPVVVRRIKWLASSPTGTGSE